MKIDHVLLIGFGAPETADDVGPYLDRFAREYGIPPERLKKVEAQYREIGGFSPYNESVFHFNQELRWSLARHLINVPVFLGMKNWTPFIKETVADLRHQGLKHGLGVVLAPHRSPASFDGYVRAVEAAVAETGAHLSYEYLESWHAHPLFVAAHADALGDVLVRLGDELDETCVLFAAHSIPARVAASSRYAEEILESSALVAAAAHAKHWKVAYHSQSGRPGESWLGPDPAQVLKEIAAAGMRHAVFVPIGFAADNAEVRYDLDIAAKAETRALGMSYARAAAVLESAKVVRMFTDLIRNRIEAEEAAGAARGSYGTA